MKKFSALVAMAVVIGGTTAASAGFFETLNKVNNVAQAVNETQKGLAEGRLEVPTGAMKKMGGGKHGGGGKHHK